MKHFFLLLLSFTVIKAMEEKSAKSLATFCQKSLMAHQSYLAQHDKTASQKKLDQYVKHLQTYEVVDNIKVCFARCLINHYLEDQNSTYCKNFLSLMPLPLLSEIAYEVMIDTKHTRKQKKTVLCFVHDFYTTLDKTTNNFIQYCRDFNENQFWLQDHLTFALNDYYKLSIVSFLLKNGQQPSLDHIYHLLKHGYLSEKKIGKLKLCLETQLLPPKSLEIPLQYCRNRLALLKHQKENLQRMIDQKSLQRPYSSLEHCKKSIDLNNKVIELLESYNKK